MKRHNELISIGMPVYNGGKYLKEAIISILSQTYPHFELIIADDCSTDDSPSIYHYFAKKDKRIRILRHSENIGSIANFNFVLQRAKGDYFMWAAQDDIRDKASLEKFFELYKLHPEAVLAVSNYNNKWENETYSVYPEYPYDNDACPIQSVYDFLKTENLSFFYGLHKTENLKRINGYHVDARPFYKSSDFLTIFKALLHGKMLYTPEVLFYKRDTGQFTKQFEIIGSLNYDKNTKTKIIRYLCFPLFYLFDLFYGIAYATRSHYNLRDKLSIILNLFILTFHRITGFIKNILKGISIVIKKFVL